MTIAFNNAIAYATEGLSVLQASGDPVRLRKLVPARGLTTGGTVVSITVEAAGSSEGSITVGGSAATIISWSATAISITTPTGTAGSQDVAITTSDARTDTYEDAFTYEAIETADSIQAQITSDLKTALQTITDVAKVEETRSANKFTDYPFLLLHEDDPDYLEDYQHTGDVTYNYTLIWFAGENDEEKNGYEPFTYQNRNVVANITKALMVDRTRGQLAINTIIKDSGHATFVTDYGSKAPGTWVIVEVQAHVNADNPFQLA